MRRHVAVAAFRALIAAGVVLCGAVCAAAASATTLHLYQKEVSTKIVNAAGHRVNPAARPSVGDRLDEVDLIYSGTAAHHTKRAVGADHLGCVIVKLPTPVVCGLQIAFGRAMLLSDGFVVNLASRYPFARVPIRDGTGRFAHAHGTIKSMPIGRSSNSNLTAVFSTR
jgi:hypothetical protein